MCLKSKILFIGTLPDTAGIGGVTIHIERLLVWLDKNNCKVDFYDYKKSILKSVVSILKHKVIHIHVSNPYLRFFYILLCFLGCKKSILTIHGDIGRFSFIKNLMDKLSIWLCVVPIVINESSYKKSIKWNKHVLLLSAFIPPYETGYFPEDIKNKISQKKHTGKIIIATNASICSYDKYGNEIYGIDFLVKFFQNKSDFILVISDSSKMYWEKYKNQDLTNVIFVTEPHSFFALIKISDIVIRATSTDGDSLSIKEALYVGKTVVATDCVSRPKQVITFKYNDSISLSKVLEKALFYSPTIFFYENTVSTLIRLYNQLMK